ncbi:MAG: hypothetical protein JWR80_547 [Bradyrhizobium sp.]|nr:hypothetical protein [Bradyrhizobium sp.]
MIILLILGVVAGLYGLALLFTLATYALPLYAGISAMFWALAAGCGILAAVGTGFAVALGVWLFGQVVFATIHSPEIRFAVALLFAIPAAFAGYHAVSGIVGFALDPGWVRGILSWIGALVIGATALQRLARLVPSVAGSSDAAAAVAVRRET